MASLPKGSEGMSKAGDIPAMTFLPSRDHGRQIYLALQGKEVQKGYYKNF